nr:galanin receptor type 1-like [Paramormyrops kingsleyae]
MATAPLKLHKLGVLVSSHCPETDTRIGSKLQSKKERQTMYTSLANMSSGNGITEPTDPVSCYHTRFFFLITIVVVLVDAVASFLSNIVIVMLLLCGKVGNLISDIFSFGLASTEVVVSSLTFCLILVFLLKNILLVITPVFSVFAFILIARPFFQCCICVERYLAVIHPVTYLKYRSLRCRSVCLGCIWSLSLVLNVILLYVQSYLISGTTFILCVAVNAFCSISILRALKKPHPGEGKRNEMNLMKRRAFWTVLVILVMTVVNYLPIIIITPLSLFLCIKHYCIIYITSLIVLVFGNLVHPLFFFSRLCKPSTVKQSCVTS